ncbi:MAG TPA: type VI secretion system tip protein TssI/VgrG, partial [Candidatus Nanopelagicales bacterium]|nr:type VI secretion system tip protein TssI/VgrG [Candidatus Nanopelagicales bacterium]
MARTLLMLGAGQGLTVREFTVHEALSSLFDISIEAVSPDPDLDFDAIVGGPASFSIFGGIESMLDVAAQGAALGEAGQLAGFDGGTTPLAGIADAIAGAVSWVAQSASQTASRFTGNLVRDAIGGPVGEALANLAADQAGQLAQSLAQRLLADVEPVLQEVSRILREADRILGQVGAVLGALGAPLPGLSGLLGSGSDQSALALGRIPTPAGDLSLRAWHGVVKNISQVRAEASGLSTYRITLAPALWLLTQRRQNRLFQRMSVVEIARKLLGEWDITPLLRLDEESYPKLELRSQYNETDYHFLARLLEDAGITWMFRQSPVGLTELLLTDRPGVTDLPRAPIPYVDAPSASSDAPHVTDVRISDEVRPGRYAVRSTNPRVPTTVDLTGRAHLDQPVPGSVEPLLALDGYSPGRLDVIASAPDAANTPTADDRGAVRALPQVGSDVAARRLQAARAQKVQVSLRSNVLDVSAGSVVPIRSHPRTDLGGYQARELLVIASTISGDWSFAQNLLSAVPAEVPWSPPRTTDRPRVRGVQTARVVGPTAEQIHTDELGRVRVQFLWDREGQRDENSSPWIRVGQPAAGTGFGINTLPRAGQEVLVEFLEGNPDTPVLVGSVYNRLAVHPHKLPESRAKTTWKTESYPTRDNFNEISLDDTPGKEVVFLHAANVMEKEVQGDEREDTGENRRIIVGGDFIVQADGHIFLQSGQNRNVDIRAGANLRFNCTGPNSTPT